ncbi:MAG: hypothetical protein IJR14_03375 [Synergistaceae bacterium]|nr:hypothetical protein [Synergistaceae bacterium]
MDGLDALREAICGDPVFFAREVLGKQPWSAQADILRSLRDHPRTAVRSCHGIGKTFVAATGILWFLFTHERSIVLSTAPTWRQVEKLIWKEIRSAYRDALVPLGGAIMPKTPELHILQNEWYAAGLSTNEPDRFQGFHEEHILVVVDEASGVNEEIFEAIDGVLTTKGARLLLLGNPTAIGGTFYDAFRSETFAKIHVSAFDTPNFTAFGIGLDDIESGRWKDKIGDAPLPFPRLIAPEWVRGRYLEWGTSSPAWQSRVLGDFPTQGEDTLIPLAWIELAMERWEETEPDAPVELGVDVAGFGSDRTVIAVRRGPRVDPLHVWVKKSTRETAGIVARFARELGTSAIKVDSIGIGQGVVDSLEEDGFDRVGVNVSERARDVERFADLRAELWWGLRERLDPEKGDGIALPRDDGLLSELASVRYKITGRGQVRVEPKDEMRKRLGRSPDLADAVVLAFAPRGGGGFVWAGGETLASQMFEDRGSRSWR